tara:strand:- start:1483 stop:1911 length:429 start_codon:yes stop_codon:yes gene_type:complete
MIKTFKGKMAHLDILRIRLSTPDGKTGYKIRKFQAIGVNPAGTTQKSTLQCFTNLDPGYTATTAINFDNPRLLGVVYYETNSGTADFGGVTIIFDDTKFNQDIFVTHASGGDDVNFYLELEQVSLTENEATVATLKDMRGRE